VTTLRNRNPNRNHLFGWSAEASTVENICGGALKLRAILNSTFLPFGVTEADVGFVDAPQLKIILATDLAEHSRLRVDSHVK
jgi:hypothetical protein